MDLAHHFEAWLVFMQVMISEKSRQEKNSLHDAGRILKQWERTLKIVNILVWYVFSLVMIGVFGFILKFFAFFFVTGWNLNKINL